MEEFVTQYSPDIQEKHYHHEEGFSTQKAFKEQVLSLIQTINDMGNPFLESTDELLSLDMQNVMDESVRDTVRSVELLGKDRYMQQLPKISNCGLYSLYSQSYQKEFSCSFQTPETEAKDQASETDFNAEG